MNTSVLRVVFMGTPEFAVASLERLLDSPCAEVVGVVTAPDRPAGRGMAPRPSAVKSICGSRYPAIPLLQPEKLRDPGFLSALDALQADLYVVVAFRMLPVQVFDRPPLGTVNLHASLLPDLRGAAPINWALMYGDTHTGVTTFRIQQEIDTGAIYLQHAIPIPADWDADALHDALMHLGAELLEQTVCHLAEGTLSPSLQQTTGRERAAPKLTPELQRLDWKASSEDILRRIRGLAPVPGAYTLCATTRLKILAALPNAVLLEAAPGTVSVQGEALRVRCADGWIELREVQPEGKRRISVADWLRGRPSLPAQFG